MYQYLIEKHENCGLKQLKAPKTFIEYSDNVQDIYRSIGQYNQSRKCNVLIVFHEIITDMVTNKNT